MAKETHYTAKETNYTAKETYYHGERARPLSSLLSSYPPGLYNIVRPRRPADCLDHHLQVLDQLLV